MASAALNPSELAVDLFDNNFNCAQSVLASFASRLGMDKSSLLKLGSPFGAGVARRGLVCGAVSGGLMALGLALGADDPSGKDQAYRLGQDFLRRFESGHAYILCRELLGMDISTPEGHMQARQKGLFKTICPLFVKDAAEIVQGMLDEQGLQGLGEG